MCTALAAFSFVGIALALTSTGKLAIKSLSLSGLINLVLVFRNLRNVQSQHWRFCFSESNNGLIRFFSAIVLYDCSPVF